jgi:hypothetical protein
MFTFKVMILKECLCDSEKRRSAPDTMHSYSMMSIYDNKIETIIFIPGVYVN